jgi:hypothetical protein
MRLSDPAELAALGRLCAVSAERDGRPRSPPWWLEANAPAGMDGEVAIGDLDPEISARSRAIEQAFIDRLASGTTVGWARRGSPMDFTSVSPRMRGGTWAATWTCGTGATTPFGSRR